MNSNRKFHENETEALDALSAISREKQALAKKIAYTLKTYRLRLLVATDDLKERIAAMEHLAYNSLEMANLLEKKEQLYAEIDLCNRQIKAYETNDDKAKLIPDRLL